MGFTRRKVVKVCSLLAVSSAWSQRLMAEERGKAGRTDAPSSADVGRLHHILRIYLPLEVAPQRTAEVLDYAARTGCSEILLFTTSYDRAPSFQSLEDTAAYVEAIAPFAGKLRKAGLTVSVNVLQTLGHVYFPVSMEKKFPFQRRVYASGRVSTEGACPLDPKLREWVAASYTIYARLKPPVMFVDDDFRTFMSGEISCFCPLHLKAIGELAGRNVTREEVVASLLSPDVPPPALRAHYYEATSRGFVELATQIRTAVAEISPETQIGLMLAGWPRGAQGTDPAAITQALAGPHRPLVRPQISFYSEDFIRDAASAMMNPARMRAVLPENFEHWPEIENYQYSLYSKSARCTFAQMAACVLNGFNHLALNVFDMFGSPLGDSRRLIEELEEGRPFLDQLHRLIPEGSRPAGVRIFEHRDQLRVRRATSLGGLFTSDEMTRHLPALGLPITYGTEAPWQVITQDDVLALGDEELDRLIARGALLDCTAASALALRGQGGRIGVTVGPALSLDELGYEQFTDPQISPELHGRSFPLRPLAQAGDWHRLTPSGKSAHSASEIYNYRHESVGPALLLTENAQGERFGIMAFDGHGNRHLMENLMRPEQFRCALGWIARQPVPICTHHSAPYLWPILNRTVEGRTVIGLINLATDANAALPLIMERQLASKPLMQVTKRGTMAPAEVSAARPITEHSVFIELRHRLEPFEVAVFVVG